jgi:hypothetical protein
MLKDPNGACRDKSISAPLPPSLTTTVIAGRYTNPVEFIPGQEASGTIAAVGEGVRFKAYLVNAQHVKNVPGRKPMSQGCQWLQ